jgi:curli biogenesis system outer membrane secretion channel CsgG
MSRLLSLFVSLAIVCSSGVFAQDTRKRVAVMNFDYSTVQSSVAAIFGTNADIGKGIADLMVERLVNSGKYRVIERKQLDKILAEQNFSNSDRVDATTAAKIGRVLGVDVIIMGSITQFGRDDRQQNFGGGVLRGVTGKYGLGGVGTKSSKAVVGLSARLVSADTAEILAAVSGKGESTRSGASLLGSGGSVATAAGGAIDMASTNFANTILGEAVGQAVSTLSAQVDANASRMPTVKITVSGLVADVSNGTVILNVGSKAGVRVGDTLQITRPIREIRDPATGKVIRRVEEPVSSVTVTEVDDVSSVGKFTGGTPKVGDAVKSPQ